jgi:DNA-binding MarR family transcriptional regulator
LELTPAGREVVDSLIPLVVDELNLALAEFSTDEVKELTRLLLKLNVSLESADEPAASAES